MALTISNPCRYSLAEVTKIWATNWFTKLERGISVWPVRLVEVGHLLKSQENLDQKEQK